MSSARAFNALVILLGLVLYAFWGYLLRDRALTGRNDFLQLYAGARLAGTPDLYNPEASRRVHREVTGDQTQLDAVVFTRLPFYALLLKPLAALPYLKAYAVFQAISAAVVAAFLIRFTRLYPETLVFAALSVALAVNFANGQDSGIVTAIAGFAILQARRGRDFTAGLLLSLGAIKPHLLVLVPLVLLVQRRWRFLLGGAAGGSLVYLLSAAADSWDWPVRFLGAVANPDLHPDADHMTTFRNLAWLARGADHFTLEAALSVLAVLAVVLAARRRSFEIAYGLALCGGLLVSHHTYTQDLTLLLMPLVLFATNHAPPRLRILTTLAASPVPCFLLFAGHPASAAVPLLLAVILGEGLRDAPLGATGTGPGHAPSQ